LSSEFYKVQISINCKTKYYSQILCSFYWSCMER